MKITFSESYTHIEVAEIPKIISSMWKILNAYTSIHQGKIIHLFEPFGTEDLQ